MTLDESKPPRILIVAPTARRDLLEIWEYIAADSHDAADRTSDRFEEAFLQLLDFPGLGRVRHDLSASRDVQFWHVGDYQIVYRVSASAIEIVAVLHGSRDIPEVLREREPDT